jgi:hypothetical protein
VILITRRPGALRDSHNQETRGVTCFLVGGKSVKKQALVRNPDRNQKEGMGTDLAELRGSFRVGVVTLCFGSVISLCIDVDADVFGV